MKCDECDIDMFSSSDKRTYLCKKCGKMTRVEQKEKNGRPTFSSAIQTASSFMETMKDFATSGFKVSDDEKYQKRIEICMGCDSFDKQALRCTECTCFMQTKAKIDSAKCPLGKW